MNAFDNIKPIGMNRPKLTRVEAIKLIPSSVTDKLIVLGIRGYYEDTMGVKGENDRGIYDDAIFVIAPNTFVSFNANTDPSVKRKGIAVLKTGVHRYRKGKHKISSPNGYPAFRPATVGEQLPVTRDGQGDSMGIAINIHKGGYNSTSSEGCQTIYPEQWNEFKELVYGLMDNFGMKDFPYVLVEV